MENTIKIGIMPMKEQQQYMLDVLSGKREKIKDEPKIWFSSMESMCQILSTPNLMLLSTILECEPESLAELSDLTGRARSNLSRTIKSMEKVGLVSIEKVKGKHKPVLNADKLNLSIEIPYHEICQSDGRVAAAQ